MPPLIPDRVELSMSKQIRVGHILWAGLSTVGIGIWVGIGVAAGVSGAYLSIALGVGAITILCHGLSCIQLVGYHQAGERPPLDLEVYGYTHVLLSPWLGFAAAWGLGLAYSTLATIAAFGVAGYALSLVQMTNHWGLWLVAIGTIAGCMRTLLMGWDSKWLRRVVPWLILVSLGGFLVVGTGHLVQTGEQPPELALTLLPVFAPLEAAALLSLAYIGCGRLIWFTGSPLSVAQGVRATLFAVLLIFALGSGVGIVAIKTVGSIALGNATEALAAPLVIAARGFMLPGSAIVVAIGAILALLQALNHVLGELVHILWSMGQRRDLPKALGRINPASAMPMMAILTVGGLVAGLTLVGSIHALWSFSAFSFLSYVIIVHLAALQLPPSDRLYSRLWIWLGLILAGVLILGLEWSISLTGVGLVVVGLIWRGINQWVADHDDR